ncbi:ABC transporter substrate-binding protein [Kribbella sp. NPDC004138]
MSFRTWTAAGLVLIAAAATAGCGGGGGKEASNDGPVTITYAAPGNGDGLAHGEGPIIKAFERANPQITVKIEEIPFAEYNTKLTTVFRGGQGPDLGRVNHTDIQTFAGGGFLAPLDDVIRSDKIAIDSFIPALVDTGKVGGKQMTLPLTTDTRVLFYNPRLLKSKGIAKPPATWDELISDVQKFAGSGVYGYGFPSDSDYALTYETVGPYMKAAGGEILSGDDEPQAKAAESAGTVDAVKLIQELVKTKAVPPGTSNMKADALYQLFSQNKIAFMLGGPWVRTALQTNKPAIAYGTDYATAPVPVKTAGDPSGSTAGGWQIGVFKNSKHQEAAGKLLAFMLEHDNLVAINKAEAFPPLKDGLTAKPWSDDPFYQAYEDVLPHSGLPLPPIARIAEVSAAFEKTVLPVIVDPSKPAEPALKDFDEQVNQRILG